MNIPERLSAVIRLAVADSKKIATTPGYKLDMALWHQPAELEDGSPDDNGVCAVCMAGAVLANSFGLQRNVEFRLTTSEDVPQQVVDLCRTIDRVRLGDMVGAVLYLSYTNPEIQPQVKRDLSPKQVEALTKAGAMVVGDNYAAFRGGRASWETYLEAADYLESEGL